MKKLSKALKAIFQIIKNPYLLNLILAEEQTMKRLFFDKFKTIKHLKQISLTEFFMDQSKVIVTPFAYLSGASLPTDLALLQLVSKKHLVQNYLEIGTWRGESVANVAPFVKNCYSLNIGDETMREMKLEDDYVNMHRFFSKDIPNVNHLFGYSQSFDFEKINTKFDLIFVDGDHHTEAVENDTRRILSLLKDENSIIVWHDAQIDPETPRYEVLMGIYSGMPQEKHKHIFLVSNSLCAIYYPFEIPSQDFSENKAPVSYFSVEIVKKDII